MSRTRSAANGARAALEAAQATVADHAPRAFQRVAASAIAAPRLGAIRSINESQGMTIFLVEQNAFHALRLADRGYVMVNGQISLSGTGDELLANPEVRAAYLEGGH